MRTCSFCSTPMVKWSVKHLRLSIIWSEKTPDSHTKERGVSRARCTWNPLARCTHDRILVRFRNAAGNVRVGGIREVWLCDQGTAWRRRNRDIDYSGESEQKTQQGIIRQRVSRVRRGDPLLPPDRRRRSTDQLSLQQLRWVQRAVLGFVSTDPLFQGLIGKSKKEVESVEKFRTKLRQDPDLFFYAWY